MLNVSESMKINPLVHTRYTIWCGAYHHKKLLSLTKRANDEQLTIWQNNCSLKLSIAFFEKTLSFSTVSNKLIAKSLALNKIQVHFTGLNKSLHSKGRQNVSIIRSIVTLTMLILNYWCRLRHYYYRFVILNLEGKKIAIVAMNLMNLFSFALWIFDLT